jgi:hypothetical protein
MDPAFRLRMIVSTLSDGELLRKLATLTSFERSSLVLVLRCLHEMKVRRLYSSTGCRSLFDYCVRSLRYSEDQAQRRIVAMKLMNEIPEIEPEIEKGNLNLSGLGLLECHFRREGLDRDTQLGLIRKCLGKTLREIEALLASSARLERAHRPDRIRRLSAEHIELLFVARASLEAKIEAARDALAHKRPGISLGELFEHLCDFVEKPNDSLPANSRDATRKKRTGRPPLHRQVFTRDGHRCTLCGSKHALEVDHIIPRAKGGPDSLENLRLLCRSCNQRAAITEFGQKKMSQYM